MKNKNLKEIDSKIESINIEKVSNEILDWLTTNVEQFIDNQVKTFKIDIILDGESNPPMPETRKLQDLYRNIPGDDELVKSKDIYDKNGVLNMTKLDQSKDINDALAVRESLNELCEKALLEIQLNKDKLQKLYERMIFYYEMVGFYKGSPLIRDIQGAVNITKFEYEAFSVDVSVASPMYKIQREDSVDTIQPESKSYTIPEGFTIWVEIAFSPKQQKTSIF